MTPESLRFSSFIVSIGKVCNDRYCGVCGNNNNKCAMNSTISMYIIDVITNNVVRYFDYITEPEKLYRYLPNIMRFVYE